MGNKPSTNKNNTSLAEEIDRIASKYILSQNFNDMNKLSEKDHCDKVVFLTAKIINQNLSPLEQTEMRNRIENGVAKENLAYEGPIADDKDKMDKEEGEKEEGEKEEDKEDKDKEDKNADKEKRKKKKEDEDDDTEQIGGIGATPDNDKESNTEPNKESDKEELDCLMIAKFYVKIAHLYAAIMKTINPVIITKDKNGKLQKYGLMDKKTVPTEEEIQSIEHNNFCSRRLNSLIQDSDYNRSDMRNIILSLKPRFCSMNYDENTKTSLKFYEEEPLQVNEQGQGLGFGQMQKPLLEAPRQMYGAGNLNSDKDSSDSSLNLSDSSEKIKLEEPETTSSSSSSENKNLPLNSERNEIGIPELVKLYYDVYDPLVGDYTSMSPDMKNIYQRDVEIFYKTFTSKPVPTDEKGKPTITTFEQIPLHEFHKSEKCKPDGMFTENYEGSLKDNLFQKYATHVNMMMNRMTTNQDKLLNVMRQLFTFEEAPAIIKKEEPLEKKEAVIEKTESDKKTPIQGNIIQNIQGTMQAGPLAEPVAMPVAGPMQAGPLGGPLAMPMQAGPVAMPMQAEPLAIPMQGGPLAGPIAMPMQTKPIAMQTKPIAMQTKPIAMQTGPIAMQAGPIAMQGGPTINGVNQTTAQALPEIKVGGYTTNDPIETNPSVQIKTAMPIENAMPAVPVAETAVPVAETMPTEPTMPANTIPIELKEPNATEEIIINPDLDEELLQSLINTTRQLIVELYVACENDFLEGIILFESIVAVQLAKTTASQLKLLNDVSLEYLDEHLI